MTKEKKMLAAIRVRGGVNTDKKIKHTLRILRLHRVNHCVVVPKNPKIEGMLKKAKYHITWGEISNDMLEKVVYKRGRLLGDKRVEKKDVKKVVKNIMEGKAVIKPVFRMSPPSRGHKPIKLAYPKGALCYRGEKINELLKRMI